MEIKNISKNIGNKKIIENINLNLEKGNIYGFIGPNGSGKSMLFKILAEWITDNKKQTFKYTHREFIEDINLRLDKSGYDNLISLYNNPDEINNYLNMFGLEKAKNKKMSTYSLGMKQKIAIIQVILEDVDVLILDEPFNGLDKKSCNTLMYILNEKRKEGKIILLTSHIQVYIDKLADYFYYIKDGKIIKRETNKLKENNFKVEKIEDKVLYRSNKYIKIIRVIVIVSLLIFIFVYIINGRIKLYNANKLYNEGKYREASKEIENNTYYMSDTAKKITYTGYNLAVLDCYNVVNDSLNDEDIFNIYLDIKTLKYEIKERDKTEKRKYRKEGNIVLLKVIEENLKKVEEKVEENIDKMIPFAIEAKQKAIEDFKYKNDELRLLELNLRIKIIDDLIKKQGV